jgi:hypothetical protein
MTYRVDRYNGTFLTNVSDGTIDNTTDLKFVGRNYTGYGEVQNENFLHLLENFANTVPPLKPIIGQIWYDSVNKKLKFYDGTKFKVASGAEIASTPPPGLTAGDLWFDTNTNQLSAWNGSSFVLIGPQSAPGFGTSQIVTQVVKDSNNTSHVILRAVVGGVTTAIFSNDDDFTLSTSNNIAGFSETGRQIKKGITLNAVSSTGVSTGQILWGTASDAQKLGGVSPSNYIRSDIEGGFNNTVGFQAGLTVGTSIRKDLKIYVNSSVGQQPIIENQINGQILVRISNAGSNVDKDDMMIFSRQLFDVTDPDSEFCILPGSTSKYNLGYSGKKWNKIYANHLFGDVEGDLTGNTVGEHTGSIRDISNVISFDATTRTFYGKFEGEFSGPIVGQASSAISATRLQVGANIYNPSDLALPGVASIPIRTSNGTIRAVLFEGQSTDTQSVEGRLPSTEKDPDTIVIRTAGADINARFFNGTSTSSRYADLAEKYLADKDYEVGTVVAIGGAAEVREAQFGDRAIGVVSENPAFRMNEDLSNGTYIALKGRVPVKVVGSVKKGDRLVASNNGCAIYASFHQFTDVFAIALESSDDTGIKIVEALVL